MVSRDFIDRARHGLYSSRARYGGGGFGAFSIGTTFFLGVRRGGFCFHLWSVRGDVTCFGLCASRGGEVVWDCSSGPGG